MAVYGYHRTSTKEQHLDRGITAIKEFCEKNGLELAKIFTDQQTGKNFDRPRYTVMKEDVLRENDVLIIKEFVCYPRQILLKLQYRKMENRFTARYLLLML